MTKEQLTQECIDSLSDCKYEIVKRLDLKHDFLVLGDALKSIVERHGEDYFVGLICADQTRDLKCTTIFDLVKPVILWE